MREAGLVVASIHEALRGAIRPGVTTRELDEVSAQAIVDGGATSNFKGYYGDPATVCISVNDVIVHGIPGGYELAPGDIVSFDCGAYVERGGRQWHGDAAFSVIVGETFVSDADFAAGERATGAIAGVDENLLRERRQLDAVTRESLWAALAGLATGKRISAVGNAVETVVAENALINGWEAGIIEEFVGHGIGTKMHMPPDVLNYNVRGIQARLKAGMVLAVEPMLTRGDIASQTDDDEWTVRTVDGRDAAHWEHCDHRGWCFRPDGARRGSGRTGALRRHAGVTRLTSQTHAGPVPHAGIGPDLFVDEVVAGSPVSLLAAPPVFVLAAPTVFRAPSGRPARSPAALRASLGASARSPSRPRGPADALHTGGAWRTPASSI